MFSIAIARPQHGRGSPEAAARTLSAGNVEHMLANCSNDPVADCNP
jgi:hypothetical protein